MNQNTKFKTHFNDVMNQLKNILKGKKEKEKNISKGNVISNMEVRDFLHNLVILILKKDLTCQSNIVF